jgi:hypothetical protein
VITTNLRASSPSSCTRTHWIRACPWIFSSAALRLVRSVAESAPHGAQRRVLNPAFGPAQVRELSLIFLDKSNEVRRPFNMSACV